MLLFFWQNVSKVYFSLGCLLFFVSFLPGHFSKIKEYIQLFLHEDMEKATCFRVQFSKNTTKNFYITPNNFQSIKKDFKITPNFSNKYPHSRGSSFNFRSFSRAFIDEGA